MDPNVYEVVHSCRSAAVSIWWSLSAVRRLTGLRNFIRARNSTDLASPLWLPNWGTLFNEFYLVAFLCASSGMSPTSPNLHSFCTHHHSMCFGVYACYRWAKRTNIVVLAQALLCDASENDRILLGETNVS